MKGIGFDDDALARPTIGVANTWIEAMPCNFHLRGLAEHIKEGVRAAGGTPMEFNTVAISDGITMGTKGMKTSLVSREVIADSIELTARGYQFDAAGRAVGLRQDDPGRRDGAGPPRHPVGDALRRLDRARPLPRPRRHDRRPLRGDRRPRRREMSDEELRELEDVASPGAGACGGQFTANTMACAFEALGISPGGSAMVPAEDDEKATVAEQIGELVDARARRGPAPEPDHHPRVARERDRLRLRLRRLDQRRPAPAGGRPRGRGRRSRSTTSSGSRAARRCSPT